MSDVVVTVPKSFTYASAPNLRGLAAWIAEGDAAGDAPTGQEWWFTTYGALPRINVGDRVYICCEDRLRGYSPLVALMADNANWRNGRGPLAFVRSGGAVAVTIPENVTGFRGWRYVWWRREDEIPFPDWKTAGKLELCNA